MTYTYNTHQYAAVQHFHYWLFYQVAAAIYFNMCSPLFSWFCPYRGVHGSTLARPRVRPGRVGAKCQGMRWRDPNWKYGIMVIIAVIIWNDPEIRRHLANIIEDISDISLMVSWTAWTILNLEHLMQLNGYVNEIQSPNSLTFLVSSGGYSVDSFPSLYRDLCPAIWSSSASTRTCGARLWLLDSSGLPGEIGSFSRSAHWGAHVSIHWFKNYRKLQFFTGKSMVSCRCSLKSTHWI